jgi:hypothetical protein
VAKKLFCKFTHERGEKVFVGGKLYVIGADGFLEVDDAHAPLLLLNDAKWADPAVTSPYKRPTGPPALILADAQGRELPPAEAAKIQQAAALKAVELATKAPEPEPAPVPPEPEVVEPEPAPAEWPTMSTDSSKRDMLANLEKLKAAGHVAAADFHDKMSKMDLLEVIERAYDSMA